jgi:hypothetical protein
VSDLNRTELEIIIGMIRESFISMEDYKTEYYDRRKKKCFYVPNAKVQ